MSKIVHIIPFLPGYVFKKSAYSYKVENYFSAVLNAANISPSLSSKRIPFTAKIPIGQGPDWSVTTQKALRIPYARHGQSAAECTHAFPHKRKTATFRWLFPFLASCTDLDAIILSLHQTGAVTILKASIRKSNHLKCGADQRRLRGLDRAASWWSRF